jgi:HEPN domain-containing protein
MRALVTEWINKAEGDRRTAKRESEVIDKPNWDAVCFHAQQAVEKYLKASLQQEGIPFSRTHDLTHLLRSLLPVFSDLEVLSEELEWLTTFSVEILYPGESAIETDAKQAIKIMEKSIPLIRSKFPQPDF